MDKRLILGIIALSLVLVIGASGCGSTPSYNYGNTAPSAPSTAAAPVAPPVASAPVTLASTPSNVASPVIPPAVGAVSVQTIDMTSYTFIPDKVTIKVGDTITWINDDSVGHKIQSDTGLFSSPTMIRGEKYERTFLVAGSYPYHCAIHPSMVGTVIVQ